MLRIVVAMGVTWMALLSSMENDTMLADETMTFRVTTRKSDDRAEIKVEAAKMVITLKSPSGISGAKIELTSGTWPEKIVIQLRLNGLESLRFSAREATLCASVNSVTGERRLWMDGHEESPLDSQSPFWTDVQILDRDGKPTKMIPLQGGYFEFQVPRKLLEANTKAFELGWIDFFRR